MMYIDDEPKSFGACLGRCEDLKDEITILKAEAANRELATREDRHQIQYLQNDLDELRARMMALDSFTDDARKRLMECSDAILKLARAL